MSNVTLQIGGRSYTVACGEGQEDHVMMLGREIDRKLASLGEQGGQNEQRSLLFAALLLADEAHELRQSAPPASLPLDVPQAPGAAIENIEELEALAERLENLAASLERGTLGH